MNKPRQPLSAIKRRTGLISSSSSGMERHALEPEPRGFIMRIRRCALSAMTSSCAAKPNTPSPMPTISG